MGKEVPMASTRRNAEVSPGNMICAMLENKNADKPNPDNTMPVVVARYFAKVWSMNEDHVIFTE